MGRVKRCVKCQALLVNRIWALAVHSVEAKQAVGLEFCTHLCLFEWLREVHGDEMTSLLLFRRGGRSGDVHE